MEHLTYTESRDAAILVASNYGVDAETTDQGVCDIADVLIAEAAVGGVALDREGVLAALEEARHAAEAEDGLARLRTIAALATGIVGPHEYHISAGTTDAGIEAIAADMEQAYTQRAGGELHGGELRRALLLYRTLLRLCEENPSVG